MAERRAVHAILERQTHKRHATYGTYLIGFTNPITETKWFTFAVIIAIIKVVAVGITRADIIGLRPFFNGSGVG